MLHEYRQIYYSYYNWRYLWRPCRFDTSNYDVDKPLPKGMNKKVIGLMKDELGEKIIAEFVALRPKAYSYLMDHGNEH